MGTNKTKSKMKYNRSTYKRYEFNVRADSKLNAILERYKQGENNNLSEIIKSCLCEYFDINRTEADSIYVPYRFSANGEQLPNNELDKYFKRTVSEK